jgi:hypothetical protein
MARIPDLDGNAIDHDHPVMILNGPNAVGDIYIIAISTKFERPIPRLTILCPWHPQGRCETGLNQECVLKCAWHMRWNKRDLKEYLGEMPFEIVEQATDYALTAKAEQDKLARERSSAANRKLQ